MIDTLTTAAATTLKSSAALIQYTSELPNRVIDTARRVNATILSDPVPTVRPTEPPGGDKVMKVLGWVGWGVFVASVAGVLFICIKMATNSHRNRAGDGGGEEAGKLFWPLLACIVGSSAGALLGAVT